MQDFRKGELLSGSSLKRRYIVRIYSLINSLYQPLDIHAGGFYNHNYIHRRPGSGRGEPPFRRQKFPIVILIWMTGVLQIRNRIIPAGKSRHIADPAQE